MKSNSRRAARARGIRARLEILWETLMNDFLRGLVMALFSSAVLGAGPVARDPLKVRLDPAGPYLILASEKAGRDYGKAIDLAKQLHPAALTATFAAEDLASARKILLARQPRYVLLFLKPEE